MATAKKSTPGEARRAAGVLAGLSAAALVLTVGAAAIPTAGAHELTPAQQRMRTCNTRAKERALDGAERTRFVNECLKGHDGDAHPLTPQQKKHEECNAAARGLEGAERRGYMTQCEKSEQAKRAARPRDKAKNCERRAKERRLTSDERAAYIRGCLNASAETAAH